MATPSEFAKQVFEAMRTAIDDACRQKDQSIASRVALALGFNEIDASANFTYAIKYDLAVSPEIKLSISYRSFDPSGPFQNLPDISRFDLVLLYDNKPTKSHRNEYEES